MKKIIVLVMVAFAANVFAVNPSEFEAFSKLNNKTSINNLVVYLNAEQDQIDYLVHVIKITDQELKFAKKNGNKALAESALNYNLHNVKCILSEEQYKKYLVFVNLSLNEKMMAKLLSEVLISENNK